MKFLLVGSVGFDRRVQRVNYRDGGSLPFILSILPEASTFLMVAPL
jgi:hypothetical protein